MGDTIQVKFHDVKDVNRFVQVMSHQEGDYDLYCGSYCVDAKSILGIMTMDLRNSMFIKGIFVKETKKQLMNELGELAIA